MTNLSHFCNRKTTGVRSPSAPAGVDTRLLAWGIQCFSMGVGFRCDSSCIHFREVNSTPKTAQETF